MNPHESSIFCPEMTPMLGNQDLQHCAMALKNGAVFKVFHSPCEDIIQQCYCKSALLLGSTWRLSVGYLRDVWNARGTDSGSDISVLAVCRRHTLTSALRISHLVFRSCFYTLPGPLQLCFSPKNCRVGLWRHCLRTHDVKLSNSLFRFNLQIFLLRQCFKHYPKEPLT